MIAVREAVAEDAAACADVMRRSIAELCGADHRGDAAILKRWLENKTAAHVAAWIAATHNAVLVAVEDGRVLAVGGIDDAGHVILNYVAPEARFRGASRAMLQALEAHAAGRGHVRCTLHSTETALRFYIACGYVQDGPAETKYGMVSYPMAKSLPAA